MPHKNERVELAIKFMRYRELARQTPDMEIKAGIIQLVAELESELRSIDE